MAGDVLVSALVDDSGSFSDSSSLSASCIGASIILFNIWMCISCNLPPLCQQEFPKLHRRQPKQLAVVVAHLEYTMTWIICIIINGSHCAFVVSFL